MPVVTREQAQELLTSEVQGSSSRYDELLEVYNEVFPDDSTTEEEAPGASPAPSNDSSLTSTAGWRSMCSWTCGG